MSSIINKLFLGDMEDAYDGARLVQLRVTHIVNVSELECKFPERIQYHQVNVTDSRRTNIMEHFPAACEFIHNALSNGGTVLVHCRMGVSRSGSIMMAYLMYRTRQTLRACWNLVVEKRDIVLPNEGFFPQLLEWEKEMFRLTFTNKDITEYKPSMTIEDYKLHCMVNRGYERERMRRALQQTNYDMEKAVHEYFGYDTSDMDFDADTF